MSSAKYQLSVACCPKLNLSIWDDQIWGWSDKKFIKAKVRTFMYMPLNYAKVLKKIHRQIINAEAVSMDSMCLSVHTSPWNMDILYSVDKDIPEIDMATFVGTFYGKVYEGPYKDVEKWREDFTNRLAANRFTSKATYIWYTTCPKCAKFYGKNYVVLLARVR